MRFLYRAIGASILLYIVAVYGGVVTLYTLFDSHNLLMAHALVNVLLTCSGVLLGIGIGPYAGKRVQWILQTLLPLRSRMECSSLLRSLSAMIVLIAMGSSLLWGIPSLNLFIDHHVLLLLEADLLLYSMGILIGIAWTVLLQAHAWFGLVVSTIGMMMGIVAILSPNSW